MGGGGGGGQGGCDQRIEVFGKIHKKKIQGGGVGRGQVWGSGWWGERRIEVFVKIKKKKNFFWGGRGGGGGGGWIRVDVNEELKFLGKLTTKIFREGGGREGGVWRGGGQVGGGEGRVGGGVRVDVNAMLGVEGDVGYGGCESRIESIVQ